MCFGKLSNTKMYSHIWCVQSYFSKSFWQSILLLLLLAAFDVPLVLFRVPGAKYGGMQPQSQDSFGENFFRISSWLIVEIFIQSSLVNLFAFFVSPDLLHTPKKSPVSVIKYNTDIYFSKLNVEYCSLNLYIYIYICFLIIQVSYAKQISESLGAQIHPDISWTSSLNTPPAVPSTLILCKKMTNFFLFFVFFNYICDL